MRKRGVLLSILSVPGLVQAVAASASAARDPSLHLKFRVFARNADMSASGRYVLLWSTRSRKFTLLDEVTGVRKGIHTQGRSCQTLGVLKEFWFPFMCNPPDRLPYARLYSLSARRWRTVRPAPLVAGLCPHPSASGCRLSAIGIGSRWIEWDYVCGSSGCANGSPYQNIATGRVVMRPVVDDPTKDVLDPNYPELVKHLCDPVKLVRGFIRGDFGQTLTVYGHIQFLGPYALLTGAGDRPGLDLERCGSSFHMRLAGCDALTVVANRHLVLRRCGPGGPVHGIRVASLRRFSFTVPGTSRKGGSTLALSSHYLYVTTPNDVVYRSAVP